MKTKILLTGVSVIVFSSFAWSGEKEKHAFTFDDLISVKRVSDPQLSPDEKWIAYTVGAVDFEKNKTINHIWITSSTPDGTPRQLTNGEKGESRPRWSPDGKWIAFTSTRSGGPQIWVIPVDGGEAKQVSDLSTGASDHVWSPTGKMLGFVSDVYPDCADDAANKKKAEEIEKSGVKAKTIDHLLYRHWTDWRDGKRSHLFTIAFDSENPKIEKAKDLTPGNYEVPPFSLGGPDSFAFSPDGKEVAYTRGPDPSVEAWSTNADICLISIDGGTPKNITEKNKGWDGSPTYFPTGRAIFYRSQERDGYESDILRLFVYDRTTDMSGQMMNDLTDSVEEISWRQFMEAGKQISFPVVVTEYKGVRKVSELSPKEDSITTLIQGKNFTDVQFLKNKLVAIGMLSGLGRAGEIYSYDLRGKSWTALTHTNDAVFDKIEMPQYESVEYEGAKGAAVQAWLVKPAGFDAKKKYPFLYFIHGGPQGAWMDAFSYRWNPMLYAAQGYVVMLPNPRGSTGFGHKFTEEISGDWAGACYEDLMKGVDWAINQGFVDADKMGAAGGSFGGYMVNWILGHNQRFKALVSHAGVYNLESMYGVTEELWFPEWELKAKPWDKQRDLYEKFSPHKFAANFKTPTLVIHGELDFRVPIGEGFQLFTALQRQGVPSKLLYYPDEGHWILKPKNSKLWNATVLDWFNRYVKAEVPAGSVSGGQSR